MTVYQDRDDPSIAYLVRRSAAELWATVSRRCLQPEPANAGYAHTCMIRLPSTRCRSCPVMRHAVSRLRPDWLDTEGHVCSSVGAHSMAAIAYSSVEMKHAGSPRGVQTLDGLPLQPTLHCRYRRSHQPCCPILLNLVDPSLPCTACPAERSGRRGARGVPLAWQALPLCLPPHW